MVYIDGKLSERWFRDWFNSHSPFNTKLTHQPFDFQVYLGHHNTMHIEIKSANFFVKAYVDGRNGFGRYECWGDKQIQKMQKLNPWVCFIIQHEKQFIIQGFIKARNLPKKKRFTFSEIQKLEDLRTPKQFLSFVKKGKRLIL